MSTGLEDPRTGLREALGRLNDVVGRVVRRLGEDTSPGHPGDAELLGSGSRALEALQAELTRATHLVAARAGHAAWEARFGAAGWAQREDDVRRRLAADPDAGTAAWFDRWLGAVSAGAWEEAWRVISLDCPLAPWAQWLPDRAAAVLQALETAPTDAVGSARQVGDLVEVLSQDGAAGGAADEDHLLYGALRRLAEDAVAGRIELVLLLSRVLALAGDPRAGDLVARARRLLGAVHTGSEASLGRAVVAAESFVQRHAAEPGPPAHTEVGGAPADLAGVHELVQQLRASEGPGEPVSVGEVLALVEALPSVAGCADRLRTLVEPPSDELVLALATRLVHEEQPALAAALLEPLRVPSLAVPLRLPAAELAVTIAELRGDPDQVAREVSVAGDEALWAGRADTAAAHYARALELRPDHPGTMRLLADALQVAAAEQDDPAATTDLRRALALVARAQVLEPVQEATSWTLVLERQAHQQLARREPERRSEHLWEALASTVLALQAAPAEHERWALLVDDLTAVGLCHTAHVAAERRRAARHRDPAADRQLVMTALNTGRAALALDLAGRLEPEPGEDAGWLEGLRGHAHAMLDHHREAEEHFRRAMAASPLLVYREWAAADLTRRGSPAAEELWLGIWKDSRLDDVDEAAMAAWAALHQRLAPSARELCARLAPTERLVVWVRTSAVVGGVVELVAGDRATGWAALEEAFGETLVVSDLVRSGQLVRTMLERAALTDRTEVLARFDRLVETARARLEQLVPPDDPIAAMDVELAWVTSHLRHPLVARVVGTLAVVMAGQEPVAADVEDVDDGSAVAEPAVPPDVVSVAMPPSWFAGLEGRETDHELFVRGLPFARAAVRRAGRPDVAALAVRVRADEACEPDQVRVEAPGRPTWSATVDPTTWSAPEAWLPAVRASRRAGAHESPVPGIAAVPAPQDATDRLGSWSPAELVARLVLGAAGADTVRREG